jgi:hypothetical protein
MNDNTQVSIDYSLYRELKRLGIINENDDTRSYNEGGSDYSKHILQPWTIALDYNLDPWDMNIVKYVLRTKKGESRILEYKKIIHNCEEKIRQLKENVQ